MMCAAQAGQRGKSVLLIDHVAKLGEKIRISGGGRCNFTNLNCRPENFLSQNPHFCRSALARYGPRDFIALVERHGIRYHEKTLGQLFCDDSAQQIIALLRTECDRGGVRWKRPCKVAGVSRGISTFVVATDQGDYETGALVIATGGLSVPKVGATPFGYQVAEQFGLPVVPPKPALVPLSFAPELLAHLGDLSGISLDAEVHCRTGRFREALLITHRGLSGPAILQISTYWQDGPARDPIRVNLLPDAAACAALRGKRSSRMQLPNLLSEYFPQRFAEAWCRMHALSGTAAGLGDAAFKALVDGLVDWQVKPSGTLGYNKAEVTLGGVDTRALSSKTLGATGVPGLFFIGEVVDVTGHLGGFNFQWAWSSAVAAAEAL
ncbi:MAG: NAD(P)/FAD-dependent oxidoreductase [Betaproteobacteria bacterium]|nr:NAD(P)/FAD-dependent oxidoreductase [Betaproteobacteria bacterium]